MACATRTHVIGQCRDVAFAQARRLRLHHTLRQRVDDLLTCAAGKHAAWRDIALRVVVAHRTPLLKQGGARKTTVG